MTDVKIVKNFLDKDFFQDLQNLITQSEFPWFQRKTMVVGTTDNLGYFTHSFYNNNQINCDAYFKYIIPILKKLNSKAVVEVRANLAPSCFLKKDACAFHTDNSYKCKTAILYLNTCDGGTEFKINDEIKFIKSEENKIVIFNSDIEHRATKSTNVDFRYILNFNYFD
jgi:Rps23 Pro-64 3,4-dihydroxylase Tpa1-like proline 4-hydroxylase